MGEERKLSKMIKGDGKMALVNLAGRENDDRKFIGYRDSNLHDMLKPNNWKCGNVASYFYRYHHTSPITCLFALREALAILAETVSIGVFYKIWIFFLPPSFSPVQAIHSSKFTHQAMALGSLD